MLSRPTRPIALRKLVKWPRARSTFSTNNTVRTPFYTSKSFRAATIGLIIGVPAGFLSQRSYPVVPQVTPLHDFYAGSLEWKGKAVKPYGPNDATAWLRKEQSSHIGPLGSGVKSWDISRRPSNSICEDNLVTAQCDVSGGQNKPWLFWGVYDGHAGWETSTTLREALVPYVVRSLSKLFQSLAGGTPPVAAVDSAIMASFQQLDDEILSDGIDALKSAKTTTEVLSRLAPGYAGSCALLSMFDPNTKLLRVACTGDSRAVLGRRDPRTGSYVATALSTDQTGFDEAELARVRAAHPDEPDVINPKTGRTLGLAITRAFGDGLWKWPLEVVQECHDRFVYNSPRPGYKTPPYVIVEPVVTTTEIQGEGEFMIMATDGLWEHMSSEQAVKLVEMWITARKNGTIGKAVRKPQPLPTVAKGLYDEQKLSEENFVVEDENVATHLVRNAFGGGDLETLCGTTGIQAPRSRNGRDDITIQVIFFEEKA